MIFGVGQLLTYKYNDFFVQDGVNKVPAHLIQFPCYNDEAFYFYVTEHDFNNDDVSSQASLSCNTLQVGTNEI